MARIILALAIVVVGACYVVPAVKGAMRAMASASAHLTIKE
jgi:hypothetical protein